MTSAKEQLTKLLWQHQGGILGPSDIDYASTQYGMQWQCVITLNSVGGHQFAGELSLSQQQAEESAATQAIEGVKQTVGAAQTQLASLTGIGDTVPGIGDSRKKGVEMFFPAGQHNAREENDGWGKGGEREELSASSNLYIKGLPMTSTEDSIRQDFANFGTIQSVKILESRPGNKCKAAMVGFSNEAEAKNVKDSFDNVQLEGFPQPLMVKYTAAPKWMTNPSKDGGKGFGKAKGDETPCDNLYVEGFPLPLTEEFVRAEFSTLQVTVLSCKVLNPRETDTCGAAMVQLSSEFEATYVKDTLNGQHPNGFPQALKVRFSERRKKGKGDWGDGKGDWGKAANGAGGKGGSGKADGGGFMDLLGLMNGGGGSGNKIDGVMQLLSMMMEPDSNPNPLLGLGLSNTSSWDAGKGNDFGCKGNDFGCKGKGKGGKGEGKGGKGEGKGWKGGGKNKSPGHMLEKTRISEWKVKGTCTKWMGKYGFVQPAEPIDHAKAGLRQGSLYVKQDDFEGDVRWLNVGQMCEFYVYEDASGLGAEEVVPF